MRVAILTTQVPFVRGGAELLAEGLRDELRRAGHAAEIVSIPFNWYPSGRLLDSVVAASLLDLSSFHGVPIDLAIGLKFPAYLARHPRKVFWLIHQHRQAYDQWEAGGSDLLHQPDGNVLRGVIEQADAVALGSAPVFTISQTVSRRLLRFNGIASTPILHPPPLAPLLHPGRDDGYLLAPGRIGAAKRQDLIVRALARTRAPVRLLVPGVPDSPVWAEAVRRSGERMEAAGRLEWLGEVSADRMAELYANARAVVIAPVDEDYGYVTLEAMLAAKPVVTTRDAGEPVEFIRHEQEGLVVAPSEDALAAAFDRLWTDPGLVARLGRAARRRYDTLDISWERVIATLTGASAGVEGHRAASTRAEGIRPHASADGRELPEDASGAGEPPREEGVPLPEPREMVVPTAFDRVAAAARAPVRSVAELSEAYDFGDMVDDGFRNYLERHWARYLATLEMLPEGTALRILDIASPPPHVFAALIALTRPGATFTAVVEPAGLVCGTVRVPSRRGGPDLEVRQVALDAERDRYPFEDGTFDLVLAMELLEHFSVDPLHMFREAARVLSPGGAFVVTTPNIASARALANLHAGQAPYSFGVFQPLLGPSARHNREYTPHEVEQLGRLAGFATTLLRTLDVYDDESDAWRTAPLAGSPLAPELRGRNIFWRGEVVGVRSRQGWQDFYLMDPLAWRGVLRCRDIGGGVLRVEATNQGEAVWQAAGRAPQLLCVTQPGGTGAALLRRQWRLPRDVAPGDQVVIDIPVGRRDLVPVSALIVEIIDRVSGFGIARSVAMGAADALGAVPTVGEGP